MADAGVCAIDAYRSSNSFFPKIPPKPKPVALSYTRSVLQAPVLALQGVLVDGRECPPHPQSPRYRIRKLVGFSNRWRLPQTLGSDLLGSAQAKRAVKTTYNNTMVHFISAESPMISLNMDLNRPYTFRADNIRNPKSTQSERYIRTAPVSMMRQPLRTFIPPNARPPTPLNIFQYHSDKGKGKRHGPDVLLSCLGMNWELHRPVIQKAETLSNLLKKSSSAKTQRYTKDESDSKPLDDLIDKSQYYSKSENNGAIDVEVVEGQDGKVKKFSQVRSSQITIIKLKLTDSSITKKALAVALGNLYHEDVEVEETDCAAVLAAAHALKFQTLSDGCVKIMLKAMSVFTVCDYYCTATKYGEGKLASACVRWLELNLVPKLSTQIYLRQLPYKLLLKVLNSSRLFTYNEYCLYRLLMFWLFLQLNQNLQLMPSATTVKTYFNSLPKSSSFLERQDGQYYASLFSALRLHGILDTTSIHDIQLMNILPQSLVVKTLMQHYYALQGGGDMSLMPNFESAAVRYGFLLEEEPHYVSEIFSVHGFHFELKGARNPEDDSYIFYMHRLQPNDPLLSFRDCERQTFSLRFDREVRYCIKVQTFHNGEYKQHSTGVLTQKFGLSGKTRTSEVLNVKSLKSPIHVSFHLLFPPS